MKGKYEEEELELIREAIQSVSGDSVPHEVENKLPNWTAAEALRVILQIASNLNQTQDRAIKNLKPYLPHRTESSIKEFIKRFNKVYQKQSVLQMAQHIIATKQNKSYSEVLESIEERKYNERLEKVAQGVIDPPDIAFEQFAKQCLNEMGDSAEWDYSPKTMLLAFPELKQTFDEEVKRVQWISGENYQCATNRLINCSLDMELVKESIGNENIVWTQAEDSQLLENIKNSEPLMISVFEKNKGKGNVDKRIEFFKRLKAIPTHPHAKNDLR